MDVSDGKMGKVALGLSMSKQNRGIYINKGFSGYSEKSARPSSGSSVPTCGRPT